MLSENFVESQNKALIWEIRAKARPIRQIYVDLANLRGVKTSWTTCWQAESVLSRPLSFFLPGRQSRNRSGSTVALGPRSKWGTGIFPGVGGPSVRFSCFLCFVIIQTVKKGGKLDVHVYEQWAEVVDADVNVGGRKLSFIDSEDKKLIDERVSSFLAAKRANGSILDGLGKGVGLSRSGVDSLDEGGNFRSTGEQNLERFEVKSFGGLGSSSLWHLEGWNWKPGSRPECFVKSSVEDFKMSFVFSNGV